MATSNKKEMLEKLSGTSLALKSTLMQFKSKNRL